MPIQKDKNTKYSLLKKKETFDSKHQSFIDKFLNEENVIIPELYIMRELLHNEFNSEFIKIDEIIRSFDINKISKSSSIFSYKKLNFFNNHYIKNKDNLEFFLLQITFIWIVYSL